MFHTALEASPNTVVESALHTLGRNSSILQQVEHFMRYLLAAHVRELFLVVMAREAVEAKHGQNEVFEIAVEDLISNILIDQISLLCGIDLDSIPTGLPMRREDNDSPRLNLGGDLASNLAKLAVSRVIDLVHDVWLVEINQHLQWQRLGDGKLTPPWLRK